MYTDPKCIFERNYQRVSTNRFVVDSPRFWRPEFNPRFKDIFTIHDFYYILNIVNNNLSFKFDNEFINILTQMFYNYFADYRFAVIPCKNPNAKEQFLSDFYFILLDILGQLSFKQYPLDQDDFNDVSNHAETAKNDSTKIGTEENNKQSNKQQTSQDYTSDTDIYNNTSTNAQNTNETIDQNSKSVSDVFMSPQNQGVKPTTKNQKYKGVDGLQQSDGANFTTNVNNQNGADSTKNVSNTNGLNSDASQRLKENSHILTNMENNGELSTGNNMENTNQKSDSYTENLEFNRSKKLLDFYELNGGRLWEEIISKMSRWILQIDIATSDRNYLDCPYYE